MTSQPRPSVAPLTVVVHGATGSQGLPVAQALLAAGHHVRGLARTPSQVAALAPGAEPVGADLADGRSLAAAYAGADAVVVQLPLVFDPSALVQARTLLGALASSGVRRVVANLGGPVPPGPVGHPYVDARVLLRDGVLGGLGGSASGAVVAPALAYADNLALTASARLVLDGTLAYPLPAEIPVPWLATSDLADAVVELLDGDRSTDGLPITLVGPEALTGPETAAAVGESVGREVTWQSIGPDAYEQMLRPSIGDAAAAGIAAMYAAAAAAPSGPPPGAGPSPRVGSTDVTTWATRQDWAALAR